jgi:uncharacterized protein (TIGR02145 family)
MKNFVKIIETIRHIILKIWIVYIVSVVLFLPTFIISEFLHIPLEFGFVGTSVMLVNIIVWRFISLIVKDYVKIIAGMGFLVAFEIAGLYIAYDINPLAGLLIGAFAGMLINGFISLISSIVETKDYVKSIGSIGHFTDARDGEIYKTVKIGTQTWLAENLRYYAEGSKSRDPCRFYDWKTAMKACPKGWHLPSRKEWAILLDFVGGNKIAGKKLKARNGWDRYAGFYENGNGTDDYGFSAMPYGYVDSDGSFQGVGEIGCWWLKDKDEDKDEYTNIRNDSDTCYDYSGCYEKPYLCTVRCVQDDADYEAKVKSEAEKVVAKAKAETEAAAELEAIRKAKGGIFTDARDGKTYKTIMIGTQMWLAENLNYDAEGSKCYDNDPDNGQKYGRLYDWETAKTACPSGWHLPSNAEWQELMDFTGYAGKKLKARNGWDKDGNGSDEFGFSAMPGGEGNSDSGFYNVGRCGKWWSATENENFHAYGRSMDYNDECASSTSYSDKTTLLSVRCIQD